MIHVREIHLPTHGSILNHRMMEHPEWPPFGIRVTTPRLELRVVREADVPEVIEAIDAGIHDPGVMPFATPFTDAERPEREHNTYRWYWSAAGMTPEKWNMVFGVRADGEFVGIQSIEADDFVHRRTFTTGSWLRRDVQGRGYGKEMRAAVLTVAFDHLGAEVAVSESFVDNPQSVGVSRALGYEENGTGRHAPRGEPVDTIRWRLTRERFEKLRGDGTYPEIEVAGVEPALPLLGLV